MDWWVWLIMVIAMLVVLAAFWLAETVGRRTPSETPAADSVPPVR